MKNTQLSTVEKFRLWNVTEERRLNEHTWIVRNNESGKRMVKKVMDISQTYLHKLLSQIECENIIKIYDVREIEDKCVVLEELADGKTLEDIVNINTISEKNAGNYILQLCNGLKKLHQCNIIHRDINPSNVMITFDGMLKIIDFDISRIQKNNIGHDTEILGTAGYAAPEQFGFSQTDNRSDIYAVGVLLNFMLTGKLPNEQIATGIFSKVIRKCIMIDPSERYLSVSGLRKDVAQALKNNRHKILGIIKKIPGFRGSNPLAAFSAIYFYATAILTQSAFIVMWINEDTGMMFRILGRFQFLFTIPFIFYTDFLDLSTYLPIIKNLSKKTGKIIFAVIGTVSLFIGIGFLTLLQVPE